jgi:hypothetical protein
MRAIPMFAIAAAFSLTGCVSMVNGSKAGDATPGIRYFLPQVFLILTPSLDGTMKVDIEYLPDPRHEYTLDTSSFLGNYTADISRTEKGFLDSVTLNSDSTAVAKQLLTSHANVKAAEVDAQAAKAKSEIAEAKAEADKQAAAVAAAQKAQSDAELAVQIADAKITLFRDMEAQPGAPTNLKEQIFAARVAQAEAIVRLNAARLAYTSLAANTAAANGDGGTKQAQAPEPVFLKVDMQKNDVKIVRTFAQTSRDTWTIPTAVEPPPDLQLFPAAQVIRPEEKSKALAPAIVRSTVPVLTIDLKSVLNVGAGKEVALVPGKAPLTAIQMDRTTVRIDMPKDTPAGEYLLTYVLGIGAKAKPEPKTQVVRLRVER